MIIDLDLKGRHVVVVGAGKEAVGKIESLVVQDCRVTVVAERIAESIQRLSSAHKIALSVRRVEDGDFLDEFDSIFLVMAVTDSNTLNRSIADAAKKKGCLSYSVDDPSHSDFGFPATINLYDTIQIAISTCGQSPLIAHKLKESTEPFLRQWVRIEDALQVQLQGRARKAAKVRLASPELRKKYLYALYDNDEIRQLLSAGKTSEAEALAMQILDGFE